MNKIPIREIKPSTTNPREELGDLTSLKESIEQRHKLGKRQLIHPILIRPIEDSKYQYEVVAGMRRYQAMKELGFNEIESIIEDYNDLDATATGIRENLDRKDLEWWEIAKVVYNWNKEREITLGDIAEKLGISKETAKSYSIAYGVYKDNPEARNLSYAILRELSSSEPLTKEFLINKIEKEQAKREDIRAWKRNATKIETQLNLIADPSLKKTLKEFWYPLRYEKNSYQDMMDELAIREGYPIIETKYLPVDKYTEEDARNMAKERHGEYEGKFEFHVIYGWKRTIEEIRNKWIKE